MKDAIWRSLGRRAATVAHWLTVVVMLSALCLCMLSAGCGRKAIRNQT